jgi:hypothetical protein
VVEYADFLRLFLRLPQTTPVCRIMEGTMGGRTGALLLYGIVPLFGEGAAPSYFPSFRMLRLSLHDQTVRLTGASESVHCGCELKYLGHVRMVGACETLNRLDSVYCLFSSGFLTCSKVVTPLPDTFEFPGGQLAFSAPIDRPESIWPAPRCTLRRSSTTISKNVFPGFCKYARSSIFF